MSICVRQLRCCVKFGVFAPYAAAAEFAAVRTGRRRKFLPFAEGMPERVRIRMLADKAVGTIFTDIFRISLLRAGGFRLSCHIVMICRGHIYVRLLYLFQGAFIRKITSAVRTKPVCDVAALKAGGRAFICLLQPVDVNGLLRLSLPARIPALRLTVVFRRGLLTWRLFRRRVFLLGRLLCLGRFFLRRRLLLGRLPVAVIGRSFVFFAVV